MPILVYELVNSALRQTFVGLTSRDASLVAGVIRRSPPASIAHWSKDTLLPLREVEKFESRLEAEKFLAGYVASLHKSSPQWTVLCEDVEAG